MSLTEDFFEKSPPQAKTFWGPFFQKFDGFGINFVKLTVFSVFNGFLTVFNGFQRLRNEKKPAAGLKIWEPLFLCAGGAPKIFQGLFHFRPRTPSKKNLVTTYAQPGQVSLPIEP